MTTLADTGAIYALIDASDRWHERVVHWWRQESRQVLLPVSILPEVCYLLQKRIGAEAEHAFVAAVASKEFCVEPLEEVDLGRAADLMRVYQDARIGFVDATVIAQAERLRIASVLTTDRRHFSLVRPSHVQALQLEP